MNNRPTPPVSFERKGLSPPVSMTRTPEELRALYGPEGAYKPVAIAKDLMYRMGNSRARVDSTRGLPVSYQKQERPKPDLAKKIAVGLFTPYEALSQMVRGSIERVKEIPSWLQESMYRPMTPETEKYITELMLDVGTRAGLSTRTTGMSTLGIFAGGRAKVKPPSIKSAAFKMPDGTIYKGTSHPTIAMEQIEKGTVKSHKEFYNAEPGFVTNNGKFLTRYEASKGFGWRENPYDKHWEFEIDDSKMKLKPDYWRFISKGGSRLLYDMIDHPKLFEAYPELKNIKVQATKTLSNGSASYDPGIIYIGYSKGGLIRLEENLIHEIQHAVQDFENWPRGGSPQGWTPQYAQFAREHLGNYVDELNKMKLSDYEGNIEDFNLNKAKLEDNIIELRAAAKAKNADDFYNRLAGEIQAREAAKRMGMTAEERLGSAPYKGAIPPEQAIIRWD